MPTAALGIVPLDEWKRRTALTFSSRGKTLVQVDSAYAEYAALRSPQNARKLYFLLHKYLLEHSGKWTTSDRNKASDGLMAAVYEIAREHGHPGLGKAKFTDDDKAAIAFWKEQREEIAKRFFQNTRLDVKPSALNLKIPFAGDTGVSKLETAKAAHAVYSLAEGIEAVRKLVEHTAASSVHSSVRNEVTSFILSSSIVPELALQVGSSLIPFKGVILSGGSAIKSGIQAAVDVYRIYDADTHQIVLETGTPQAAFRSMLLILEREKSDHTRKAIQSALQAGAHAVSQALDPTHLSQAAISGGFAIATIVNLVFLIGRDFLERSRANAILRDPGKIDATICQVHPILGCYLLVGAEMSTLIAFFANFGNQGWMDQVEMAVKEHLTPLQERAGSLIDDSRFQLMRDSTPVYPLPGIWRKMKKWKNGQWDVTKA